jgi:hypothetical protein
MAMYAPWLFTLPFVDAVQTPGIRPSDVLHKNSTAVQGVEARVCCIPLCNANRIAVRQLAMASERVLQ